MDLDRWVMTTTRTINCSTGKGLVGLHEMIRSLMYKFGAEKSHVVATYSMRTPPPEEDLLMRRAICS